MAMLILPKNSTWIAMLIFLLKINMDGHIDFFIEKSTWMAMLIFTQKNKMDGHADSPQKFNMDRLSLIHI